MKIRKINIARIASSFVAAFAIAVVPFAGANAATNIWNGTTNTAFGTATNWSTGAVPLDGDAIVFDSSNTTTPYPTIATALTNATGNAFASLTAQGTTANYNFTINALKTAANATLSSADTTNNLVTITALTANGNVTLDGVSAGSITLPSGGIVTLKNQTGALPTITGATSIVLDNDGTINPTAFAGFSHTNPVNVTITGSSTPSNLTLANNTTLGTNFPLTVAGTSVLTLPANTTITTPITMTAGQIKMSAAGTTTITTLNVTTAQSQYVLPATAYLYATTYTQTSPGTFVAGFGNAGTFTAVSSGTGTTTTTTGTGATGGSAATTTTTATPSAPNTAFSLILANPFVIAAATIAIVAAGLGIMKFRKQQQ